MSDTAALEEMIAVLARGLVETPDEVRVQAREDRDRTVFELMVPDGQRGQVIGRGGRIAHALRTVTQAAGRSQGIRAALDIVD
jgi:predicted RNA-binding protein YlqC (UPF0109 family)